MPRPRSRALLVLALLLVAAAAGLIWRGRAGSSRSASPAGGPAAAPGGAGARRGGAPAAAPVVIAPATQRATGATVVRGGWGSAPGEFGHLREDEGNAEGPMSLAPGRNGELLVLDQVNARIQRFRRDGSLAGELPIGPNTAQDLAVDRSGRVAVLDRLGNAEILLYDESGAPAGTLPVVGGPITEGGGVTGIFAGQDGLYLEREHTEVIRVAGPDGRPDPDRPSDPGRPTRDGTMFLAALLADASAGQVVVRAFDHDGRVVWQRLVTFPQPVIHLLLLDSDLLGHVYLGAFVATEGPAPEFALTGEAVIVARLAQADGAGQGSLSLPASREPEEVFRELAVTDEGEILHMLVGADGISVTKYTFP